MKSILFMIFIVGLFVAGSAAAETDSAEHAEVLLQFLGEWEGRATAYHPRQDDREPREEVVTVKCTEALKGTYVECHSVWELTDGRTRELLTFWNYDREASMFEILYMYDNWPGKVNYQLEYNAEERTLRGYDTFDGPGGVAAEERVVWEFSEDGTEIYGTEYNHYETDDEDYWPATFEFVWRRVK